MADRERPLPRLRKAYNPGRSNFEQPGLGGQPLELERLPDARLVIVVADTSEMQPGLERGYEIWRQFTAALVAEFSALEISCADGFYLESLRSQAGGAVPLIVVRNTPAVFSTLAGTLNRSQFPAIPRLTVTQGRLAASLGSQFFLGGGSTFDQPRLWIPPGFFLLVALDTANIQSDFQIVLSGTTTV